MPAARQCTSKAHASTSSRTRRPNRRRATRDGRATRAATVTSASLNGTQTNLQGLAPTNLFDAVERHARALTTGTGRSIVVRGPLQQPIFTFDFATAQPLIKTVVATPDPAGRPQVSFDWPAVAPADGITVMMVSGAQRWRFVVPGDRRAVTAPELPVDLAEWALKGTIEQRVVMAYEVDVLNGYDDFRNPSLEWAAWTRDDQLPRPILPKNATLRRVEGR